MINRRDDRLTDFPCARDPTRTEERPEDSLDNGFALAGGYANVRAPLGD